ncbi:hypothetical protein [Actinomyces vulturis]|uniref:hypothetical protein n=1 Tax=Actinomyces vulturis TaxID=1857645 RepID=UPI000830E12B|nr:hypothetical protein [Actinomyces vulturis]
MRPTSHLIQPGPKLVLTIVTVVGVLILGIAAAVTGALGMQDLSQVFGAIVVLIVGVVLVNSVRVGVRWSVINSPRLRIARMRAEQSTEGIDSHYQPTERYPHATLTLRAEAGPLEHPSARGVLACGQRELTLSDVTSGAVTTYVASSAPGQWVDDHLAGTTTGETLLRVAHLFLATIGFVFIGVGIAGIVQGAL